MSAHKTPRILFLVNSLPYFYSHRLCLALAAQKEGFEVHIAAPHHPELEADVRTRGFIFAPIPMDRKGINPLVEIRSFLSVLFLLMRLKPDVLHLIALKAAAYGGLAARLTGIKGTICAVAGLGFSFSSQSLRAKIARRALVPLLKLGLHKRARVIFQNPDDLALFTKLAIIDTSQAVLIRGAGVDTEKFVPMNRPTSEETVVVLAARMLWDKGVGEFYEAAKKLKRSGTQAKFRLLGGIDEGNPSGIPAQTLHKWQQEGFVEWKGAVKNIASEYAAADIACLPSVYAEGLPKSLIEAASCGLPLVTTDTPGCRDICRHEWNGLLVPSRNADALALALERLIESNELRSRMGQRGRHLVEKEFAEGIVVEQTLTLYRQHLQPTLSS